MMPSSNTDFKKLFSELIKKQMVILGPDITFAKVRNVVGLKADINGDVQSINGDPHVILQELINQFVTLSGEIVKKTMETMLASAPQMEQGASSSKIEHVVPIPSAVEPEPLHSITVNASTEASAAPDTATSVQASSENSEIKIEEPQNQSAATQSPDQRIDPLVHEVQMPGGTGNKSEPPSFSSNELDSLNQALQDADQKSTQDSNIPAQ